MSFLCCEIGFSGRLKMELIQFDSKIRQGQTRLTKLGYRLNNIVKPTVTNNNYIKIFFKLPALFS